MKSTTKKFFALLLVFALLLSLAACAEDGEESPSITTTAGQAQEGTTPGITPAPETTPEAAGPEVTPAPTDPPQTTPAPTIPPQTTPAPTTAVPTTPAATTPPVAPLVVTKQPANKDVNWLVATVQFSVSVSGGVAPYRYQWYAETQKQTATTLDNIFAKVTGADTATVGMNVESNSQTGSIWCVITDAMGNSVTSSKAQLKVDAPLMFTKQPLGEDVVAPCWIGYSVRVSGGTEPYKYQWYTDASGKVEAIPDDYAYAQGGQRPTVNFWVHEYYRTGKVWCVVKDAKGKQITSDAAELKVTNPLYISWHPSDITAAEGSSATFLIEAAGGTAPYSYKWYYDNGSGEKAVGTGTSLTLSNLKMEDNGAKIWCVVSDAAGAEDTSAIAVITVKPAPTQPPATTPAPETTPEA